MSFLSELFGGGSSSSSSASTSQYDNRNVLGADAAYIGAGGSQDRSTHTALTTNWADSSNHSTNWADSSTNNTALSTNWADSSSKNSGNTSNLYNSTTDNSKTTSNIYNTVTDGGSLELASKAVIEMHGFGKDAFAFGTHALDTVGSVANNSLIQNSSVVQTALGYNASTLSSAISAIGQTFTTALGSLTRTEATAQAGNNAAFSAASNQIQTAYADAKGRGANTDKMMMLALAVAGLVAFHAVSK